MLLDRATRASLELVKNQRDGDRRGTLLDTMDRCVTAMGARLLKSWVLAPLVDADEIRGRHDAVAELLDDDDCAGELRKRLRDVLDVERLAGRLGCERANPRDLVALRESLATLPELRHLLESAKADLLRATVASFPELGDLVERLSAALVDEPPMGLREGGLLREGFNAEVDELRALGREGKGFIAAFQAREAEATQIPSLKIGYNKVFGYYIEVTNSHKDKVPTTYLRKQTLKNAERYITEELKEYEDKVLNAEERSKALEYEIFCELREAAALRLDEIQQAARAIAQLDVLRGLAWLAREDVYVRPELVDDEDLLSIEEGRHPVLARPGRAEPFVPNDVALEAGERLMLITGPNMAGKSTYIRQVAIITLMAQIGSFVPARAARLSVHDRVFTRVGASDDLAGGASTFMVEMLEVANIANNASRRSLVILDEVGRGTSTYDGLSLAWAITEHLAEKVGAKTLFATHYHELTRLAESHESVANYNVAVRERGEEIHFLHRIVAGATDRSYGIHVARLAGLPAPILSRARVLLSQLEQGSAAAPSSVVEDEVPETQLNLFSDAPDALRTRLREVALEETTPLEALNLLAELRGLL